MHCQGSFGYFIVLNVMHSMLQLMKLSKKKRNALESFYSSPSSSISVTKMKSLAFWPGVAKDAPVG